MENIYYGDFGKQPAKMCVCVCECVFVCARKHTHTHMQTLCVVVCLFTTDPKGFIECFVEMFYENEHAPPACCNNASDVFFSWSTLTHFSVAHVCAGVCVCVFVFTCDSVCVCNVFEELSKQMQLAISKRKQPHKYSVAIIISAHSEPCAFNDQHSALRMLPANNNNKKP